MMTRSRTLPPTLVLTLTALLSAPALAHGGGPHDPRVELHVGYDYQSCYFDLHPELTARQFRQFAAEGGQVVRFRQTSGADTLGAGIVDLGLGYQYIPLDDTKGAWNNTMSHPGDDHYLGQALGIPYLTLRVGVSEDVDAELYGTANVQSNYGFVGLASKIRLVEQRDDMPVSVAVRPSASGLIGPAELQLWNLNVDLSVSHRFHGITPFLGVGLGATVAVETSDDVDLDPQVAVRPTAFAGVDFNWRFISVGVEAEISDLFAVSARLGGRF